MTKLGVKVAFAGAAAVCLYGGSLYVFAAKTAKANEQAALAAQVQTVLQTDKIQLAATVTQEQKQIVADEKAISQLKANLQTVQSHTSSIQQHTQLLNKALNMLQQGTSVDSVVKLIQSGNVPVKLPAVPKVSVQKVTVSSTPPPVTTVSRGSGG